MGVHLQERRGMHGVCMGMHPRGCVRACVNMHLQERGVCTWVCIHVSGGHKRAVACTHHYVNDVADCQHESEVSATHTI